MKTSPASAAVQGVVPAVDGLGALAPAQLTPLITSRVLPPVAVSSSLIRSTRSLVVVTPSTNVIVTVPALSSSTTAAAPPVTNVTVTGGVPGVVEAGASRISSSPTGPPWVDGVHSAKLSLSSSVSLGCRTPSQLLSSPSQNACANGADAGAPAFTSEAPGLMSGSVSSQSSPRVPTICRLWPASSAAVHTWSPAPVTSPISSRGLAWSWISRVIISLSRFVVDVPETNVSVTVEVDGSSTMLAEAPAWVTTVTACFCSSVNAREANSASSFVGCSATWTSTLCGTPEHWK